MIPAMSRSVQVINQLRLLLSRCALLGFFRLPATVGTLLLRLVVRMSLFVVVAALPAKEEQNLLSVPAPHIASLRSWPRAVKGTTLPLRGGRHG